MTEGKMDGQMGEGGKSRLTNRWKDGKMNEWVDGKEQMDGRMDGQLDDWMNGRSEGWIHGQERMDGQEEVDG